MKFLGFDHGEGVPHDPLPLAAPLGRTVLLSEACKYFVSEFVFTRALAQNGFRSYYLHRTDNACGCILNMYA